MRLEVKMPHSHIFQNRKSKSKSNYTTVFLVTKSSKQDHTWMIFLCGTFFECGTFFLKLEQLFQQYKTYFVLCNDLTPITCLTPNIFTNPFPPLLTQYSIRC